MPPAEFDEFRAACPRQGLPAWSSASPLTRSSYHAGDDFAQLRAARAAQLHGPNPAPERPELMPTHAETARYCPIRRSRCSIWSPTSNAIRSSCPGASAPASAAAKPIAVVADLVIGFKMFRERFTSRVTLDRPGRASTWPTPTARSAISTITGSSSRTANGHCRIDFYRRFRVPLGGAAEADRRAVQRGRAPHGRGLREPRQEALWGRRRRYQMIRPSISSSGSADLVSLPSL